MLPPDKLKHFAVGAAITGACVLALGALSGAMLGAGVTLAAAIARELYNRKQGGKFDIADIAATCIGVVAGFGGAWLLLWLGGQA